MPTLTDTILSVIDESRVYDVADYTPLVLAKRLSQQYGIQFYLKREDLQPVFSFKCRGAYEKIARLDHSSLQGVLAASAGNHAQGVALAAQKFQIPATIVMPKTTPGIKVEAVKALGATVVLHGNRYDDAVDHALNLEKSLGYTFIHPFDDPVVMAGQGTIAKEILTDLPQADLFFIPVGGGGLIGGMSAYIKKHRPSARIIAVEANGSACLKAALDSGQRIVLDDVDLFADGVAVKQIGKFPFDICKTAVDDVIVVDTDDICAAIKDIYQEFRLIVEPAGALSVAAMKRYFKQRDQQYDTKCVVGICCGANLNFDRLRHISERAEIGEQKEALFSVKIPEEKGSFLQFVQHLKSRGITEFNYRYSGSDHAFIFVGVALGESDERQHILKDLSSHYHVIDLTDNDVAKLHVRHMIGGKQSTGQREVFYRFQFPERPGALVHFLKKMGASFSISMFHYRNHGAAFGRVLVGLFVSDKEEKAFQFFLKDLNYVYYDESANPVFDSFF